MYCILPLCTLVNRNPRMNRKTDSSSRQNNKMKTVFGNYIVKCVGITSYGHFHYHLNFFCERRRVGTDGPFLDAIWYVIFILDTFQRHTVFASRKLFQWIQRLTFIKIFHCFWRLSTHIFKNEMTISMIFFDNFGFHLTFFSVLIVVN